MKYKNCTTTDIFIKKVYKTIQANELFDKITKSTYEFNDPGFLLIDKVNEENNLWFVEVIRTTNPCEEIPMSPNSSCLLGSLILPPYITNPFSDKVSFDFAQLKKDVRIANRLLDNVVEIANLPLKILADTLNFQRRHGLGFTGLGSALNMLKMSYGSKESIDFADKVMLIIAQESLLENIEIAKEKGCAPVFSTKKSREQFMQSGYMKRLLPTFKNKDEIVEMIMQYGVRWSHATSIAPTGTMSLTWGNNCSNGIGRPACLGCARSGRRSAGQPRPSSAGSSSAGPSAPGRRGGTARRCAACRPGPPGGSPARARC